MAKIFITRKIPESGVKLLKKKHTVKIYGKDQAIPKNDLLAGVKWCDALLPLLTDKVDGSVMDANPNLKVIANYAVGFNNIDVKAATERGIPVTNTPGVLTDAVADHAAALLLGIARRIPESDRFTRAGKYKVWSPMLLLGPELRGKTLGILGSGRIGSAFAERMYKGFGMNIMYYDVKRNPAVEKKFKAKYGSIAQVLKTADFVSIHVPLLPSTHHLIGAKELKSMKKTSYLINTSRGPVIDEKALVSALKSKTIAGAALDVFENEPKLASGLSKLENVILTPHTASATEQARGAMSEIAANNILAVLSGKKPITLVNPDYTKAKK